jgi:hypothetical protein
VGRLRDGIIRYESQTSRGHAIANGNGAAASGRPSSLNPTASGGSPRGIAKPEPSIRRSPREGRNPHESIRPLLPDTRSGFLLSGNGLRSSSIPVASIRPALRRDPKPRKAYRTGFPFIGIGFPFNRIDFPCNGTGFPFSGTGFRLNRFVERMNGCAERSDWAAVSCKI